MSTLPGSVLAEKKQYFTYADYKGWELAEGERFELIYGEVYEILKPNSRHQEILGAIFTQIANYLTGKPCKVYLAPFDVRLFYAEDESDDTVVQPDITVVCDPKKHGPEGCRGAPDMVIEILSPSNTVIEMQRKLKLYQDAGVREYWIVDPESKNINVYRFKETDKISGAILFYTLGKDTVAPVGIFPGLDIDLEQVFAD